MSPENVEVMRQVYDAFNRGDWDVPEPEKALEAAGLRE